MEQCQHFSVVFDAPEGKRIKRDNVLNFISCSDDYAVTIIRLRYLKTEHPLFKFLLASEEQLSVWVICL